MNLITKSIWLSLFLNNIWYSHSETSLPKHIDIEDYLETQHDMISAVRNHFTHERRRLKLLKKYELGILPASFLMCWNLFIRRQLKRWKSWRKSYFGKESEFIAIPQNLLHLFKNMTLDLANLEDTMMENSYNETMAKVEIAAPSNEHLESVVMSLIDLQYSYDLKPENIMKGELLDYRVNSSIPTETCLYIGETCFKYNEHKCVVDWLNACIPSISDKEQFKKVYKFLYPSYLLLNDTEQAYKFASAYLSVDPVNIPANDVKISLGDKLDKPDYLDPIIVESHKVCRGVYKKFMDARNLTCRYNHENSPFLKIAPLKEELLYEFPKVILYYDAVYESEMNIMKSIGADLLSTSTVYGTEGERRITGFVYRISQTAFIDNSKPELSLLAERIKDMSALSLNRSEWWQVVNYAPGGFYRVHADYLPAHGDYVDTNGNRIATLLFYLNNVALGGETVFPRLKLSVTPVKGSALIWHNVLPDQSENILTQHCSCPVIFGEKWIFTQWLRGKDQKCLRHIYEKYVQ